MAEIASAYVSLIPSYRGGTKAISQQMSPGAEGAGTESGSRFGAGFLGSLTKSLGGAATAAAKYGAVIGGAALAGVGALSKYGIRGAASLQTTTTAFTSLLGSSQAATAQIQALQKFAAATPFSQTDVLGYAQQFFSLAGSIGMSKDQVQPFLSTIGNLGAVTGASTTNIANAVTAIGQIGSAGKVSLDNLNQISEAFPGFNGAAAIAAATGKSTAETMKDISAGSIDAKTGVAALLKGMQQFPGAAGAMTARVKPWPACGRPSPTRCRSA
jgi:tape measure domain-containing protein